MIQRVLEILEVQDCKNKKVKEKENF